MFKTWRQFFSGWFINDFLGYDLFASCYQSTSSIAIGNLNNGSLTDVSKASGTSYYSIGQRSIATSPTTIYDLKNDRKFTIDRNALTYTSSTISYSNVSGTVSPIGVTSDGKVMIVSTNDYNTSYGTASHSATVKFMKISDDTIIGYNIDEYPERLKGIVQDASSCYYLCFNPNNNVLTVSKYSSVSNPVYGFFKYDTVTETWSEIFVDLSSVLANFTGNLHGVITTSQDMSRIGITVSNSGYNSTLCIIQLQAVSNYKYVAYKYYDITQDTLTGIASENIAVDTEGDATTVLPPELNVSIQSTQNNANIIIE